MVNNIAIEELKDLLDKKVDFVLLDVRSYAGFLESHIKGAKNVPVDELEKNVDSLDRSKLIVVYCGGPTCPLSGYAFEKLNKLGFNVRAFEGGISEWKSAGYAVE